MFGFKTKGYILVHSELKNVESLLSLHEIDVEFITSDWQEIFKKLLKLDSVLNGDEKKCLLCMGLKYQGLLFSLLNERGIDYELITYSERD